jgi:hypothetical protein
MAPKNKDAGKGKGKSKSKSNDDESSGAGKLKAAQSINVRHILVGDLHPLNFKTRCLKCDSARSTPKRKKP